MRNTYKIIWSDEALIGLKEIISYLEHRFSEEDVKKFVKKLDKQINLIKTHPQTFPLSSKSKYVRRAIVAKLTSIYFLIEGESIKLITITDNRKNPRNIKV